MEKVYVVYEWSRVRAWNNKNIKFSLCLTYGIGSASIDGNFVNSVYFWGPKVGGKKWGGKNSGPPKVGGKNPPHFLEISEINGFRRFLAAVRRPEKKFELFSRLLCISL